VACETTNERVKDVMKTYAYPFQAISSQDMSEDEGKGRNERVL